MTLNIDGAPLGLGRRTSSQRAALNSLLFILFDQFSASREYLFLAVQNAVILGGHDEGIRQAIETKAFFFFRKSIFFCQKPHQAQV